MSSKIEWTEDTWNPVIGCDKVSAGCKNCYAINTAWIRQHNPKMLEKYGGVVEKTPGGQLNWTGKINISVKDLDKPVKNKKPTVYFVNSMSDLFHDGIDEKFIAKVFAVMSITPHHTYQVLTKRPQKMNELMNSEDFQFHVGWFASQAVAEYQLNREIFSGEWPLKNVWMGVSVENQAAAESRIPYLISTPAAVRFLSCEPLLGPVNISSWIYPKDMIGLEVSNLEETEFSNLQQDINWVIVGGESGPGARPMHPDWARSLRDQCRNTGVAYFFKQWGNWLPFEPTAQPPFYRACSNGEEFDAHGMNFINGNHDPGRWKGGIWMDGLDALMYCDATKDNHCMFLKLHKNKISKKLDGKVHAEYPTIQEKIISNI